MMRAVNEKLTINELGPNVNLCPQSRFYTQPARLSERA